MWSSRSWPRLSVVIWIGVVAALLGAVSVPLVAPTVAAAACPGCYGMQLLSENLFVNEAMPEGSRLTLQKMMSDAEMPIAAFFGSVSPRRVILACGDESCETRLKGRLEGTAKVRAFAYDAGGYAVVRFSPRGLNRMIITHELTHVEVHERIGFLNHMRGVFPAWFDEGLAVVLSDDRCYLKPGLPTPDGELPSTPCDQIQESELSASAAGRRELQHSSV